MAANVDAKNPGGETNESAEKEFQKIYQELLHDLMDDPESPSIEFVRLQELWRKSRESESRLAHRCRELQAQGAAAKARALASAAKSKEDQSVIASLKKEVEKAWKLVDECHDREQSSLDVVQGLQREIEHLNRMVDHGSSLTLTKERLSELQKVKEDLMKENDDLHNEIVDLKDNVSSLQENVTNLSAEKIELHKKLDLVIDACHGEEVARQREVRLREKVEVECRQARAETQVIGRDLQVTRQNVQHLEECQAVVEERLKSKQVELEEAVRDLELSKIKWQQCHQENELCQRQMKRFEEDIERMNADMKSKEDEGKKLLGDNVKLVKLRDSLALQLRRLHHSDAQHSQQAHTFHNRIELLQRESWAAKKQTLQDEKLIDGLLRKRNAMNKSLMKAVASSKKQSNLVKATQVSQKCQMEEIGALTEELDQCRRLLSQVESGRDKLAKDNGDLRSKMECLAEEGKAKDALLHSSDKKLAEMETRWKQLQTSYEALKSERSSCARSLVDKQDEVVELRLKLKRAVHDVEQLTEEIGDKESALQRERQTIQKLEKEQAALRAELKQNQGNLSECRRRLEGRKSQESKILRVVADVEREKLKSCKETEKLINEKNKLVTQLTLKGEEATSLDEKAKSLAVSLNGENVRNGVLSDDIRLLTLETKRLRRENHRLGSSVYTIEELQGEIRRLHKGLMKERIKGKALEVELENPHNVHRWRRLAGSDPTAYELVQKIHVLQRRLIYKTETSYSNRDRSSEDQLDHLLKNNEELKRRSSDTSDRVLALRQTLRDNEKHIKSLTSENEMHLVIIENYKRQLDETRNELQEAKHRIMMLEIQQHPLQKDRQAASLESGKHLLAIPAHPSTSNSNAAVRIRSLGSGFRVFSASPSS